MSLDCRHLSLSAFSHNFMIQGCYIKIATMRENNLMQLAKVDFLGLNIFSAPVAAFSWVIICASAFYLWPVRISGDVQNSLLGAQERDL
jgi:hypothetical protein